MSISLPASVSNFYALVLSLSIQSLKINTYTDNFDAARFNTDGKDHSTVFDTNSRTYYFDWFFRNHGDLFGAYSMLEDDMSKLLFIYLIAYRMAGHHSIRLPLDFVDRKAEFEQYLALETSVPSALPVNGMFGNLRHYDFEHEGKRYVADTLGFEPYLFRRQYFYDYAGVCVAPEAGDAVIDGGACLGDTALVFSNAVGEAGKVYAFDPVREHLDVLAHNIGQFPHKNVTAMPYGLSDREVFAPPLVLNQYAPGFSSRNQTVPLRSIDHLVSQGEIDKIDFIKLDVEGAELETLNGAQNSIRRFRPKLAVSLYHKPNDLFELVRYVKGAFPFYKLYLGHYTIHAEETVLYCKP